MTDPIPDEELTTGTLRTISRDGMSFHYRAPVADTAALMGFGTMCVAALLVLAALVF